MVTQATRLIEVQTWRTGERAAPRRRARSLARGVPSFARDVAGGLLVAGTAAALWTWFLAAMW